MVAQDVLGKAAEQDAIERGMRAAQQLGDLAANSTTAVSDQRMNLRAEIEAQLKPPDPPPGGDAIGGNLLAMQTTPMQGLTLALDSKMGSLVNDIETLINPPPRKRTVYGAAQAIEKGSLRPPPTPPPPRVYNVHAPEFRVKAAMDRAKSPGPTGSRASALRRTQSASYLYKGELRTVPNDAWGRQSPRHLLKSPNREDYSIIREDVRPERPGSPTAPRRFADGALLRDGLTPGQRALGARAPPNSGNHARCHQLVTRYGHPVLMPIRQPLRPKSGLRRSESALMASKSVEFARRKARAQGWLDEEEMEGRAPSHARPIVTAEMDGVIPPGGSPRTPRQEYEDPFPQAPSPTPAGAIGPPGSPLFDSPRLGTPPMRHVASAHQLRASSRPSSGSALQRPLSPALSLNGANEDDQLNARYSFFPLTATGLAPNRPQVALGMSASSITLARHRPRRKYV